MLGEQSLFGQALIDRLGDAEIGDIGNGLAVLNRHQHVRRFNITVNDILLMSVLDRLAHRDKEFETLPRRHLSPVTKLDDRLAANEFHHEIRPAGVGRSGFENACDVLMIHHRERLAFGLEPRHDLIRVHAGLDDLERDLAADGLLLLGHEDDAHAAFADVLNQFI